MMKLHIPVGLNADWVQSEIERMGFTVRRFDGTDPSKIENVDVLLLQSPQRHMFRGRDPFLWFFMPQNVSDGREIIKEMKGDLRLLDRSDSELRLFFYARMPGVKGNGARFKSCAKFPEVFREAWKSHSFFADQYEEYLRFINK